MGRRNEYVQVMVLLPRGLYREFRALVGSRKVSPTLRRAVENHVADAQWKARLEGGHDGDA